MHCAMGAAPYVFPRRAAMPSIRTGDTPVHSPIKDLALSSFTEVAPLARPRGASPSFLTRMRARWADWRHHLRSRNELGRLTARDWAVGDYGVSR